jgi:hypothetical protein
MVPEPAALTTANFTPIRIRDRSERFFVQQVHVERGDHAAAASIKSHDRNGIGTGGSQFYGLDRTRQYNEAAPNGRKSDCALEGGGIVERDPARAIGEGDLWSLRDDPRNGELSAILNHEEAVSFQCDVTGDGDGARDHEEAAAGGKATSGQIESASRSDKHEGLPDKGEAVSGAVVIVTVLLSMILIAPEKLQACWIDSVASSAVVPPFPMIVIGVAANNAAATFNATDPPSLASPSVMAQLMLVAIVGAVDVPGCISAVSWACGTPVGGDQLLGLVQSVSTAPVHV